MAEGRDRAADAGDEGPEAWHALVRRFIMARRAHDVAVLEGYHPLKHALRFGARVREAVVASGCAPADLPPEVAAAGLAPREVPPDVFDRLVTRRPPVPLVALAKRPGLDVATLSAASDAPLVVLERPSHAGNAGAAVRVAAAAGAAGLLVVGRLDPWGPPALRGGAGLQFALPVTRVDVWPATDRPLVALDPAGQPLRQGGLPRQAALVFGTERGGLSEETRRHADLTVAIPMRPGVSSLNLATAVAVALYAGVGLPSTP
ncbi:MAG TPA: TrmH family RNA methyltransferase [Nitriliruptorales bacterium]|nr:TrmH family RNA methyltransferase [Nitriliruptorales bacterium]